ncbi:MocR-like pyridoxine biosynthesis transcription factor PdxR [Cytobacillus purgationiresistens]|uniref:GntR family transcriptional regulator/MocR family aminotransferase n=1 Tax=Cytobacillus purgationiresistens TaxID=863449 RepID=A0ABU0AF53_9BACI|nr:PLP-dependent aminotransferase family protein [Cytobacillus purgationiresistens]MDQ0269346.1 GntR family transcriptional regulator/MocR family aminotransferase [Cytobacillus purgationiresistens]
MEMLSCELNRNSSVPLYEQLYLYIKKEITQGRLVYGTKLPSKRKLANFLEISQNTVETSYDQLTAEGYVEVIARKGYYVQTYEDLEYIASTDQSVKVDQQNYDDIRYNFHPSHIDTVNFPFEKWRKYFKNTMDRANHKLLLLGDNQGEYDFRCEIAHYLYHSRGVRCTPDQIIIGAGVETLLQQLVLLWGEKTVYGVEDPGYHLMLQILKNYPNKVFPLDVDEEGVDVEEITNSNIDVVYATPSHHFPYGTVLSINRRQKLLNWANDDENRFIIEDDYDSEFRYNGKTIPSLQSMDFGEKVIYLGAFSKSLMPSVRISYMVLPTTLMDIYRNKLSFYHSTVSRIDQKVLTEFMKQGDFEKHLNRMRKVYRRKLDRVLGLIKPYEDELSIIGERSGLHIVLVVKNGMDETTLVQKALNARLKIYPLSGYSIEVNHELPPRILLGFAGIPEEELEIAIMTLLSAWGYKQ